MDQKVSSGSKVIDSLLNGGFEKEVISTIYGGSGAGKTNVALLAALNSAVNSEVVFIDTEGGFSIERAQQLAKDAKQRLKNVLVYKPTTFKEQEKVFTELEKLSEKSGIKLIVVDSISMLYRLELGGADEAYHVNKEMARQMGILRKLSHDLKIPIILTNQVYADFKKPGDVKMVGGDLMKYFSKCIIKLEVIDKQIRKAELVKHRSLPNSSVYFEICEDGLFESEKKEKKFSLF